MKGRCDTSVPRIAQFLLGCAAGPKQSEFVLGDLQEAYTERLSGPNATPKYWVWREVGRAVPGLVSIRLRNISFRAVWLSAALTFCAYLALKLWRTFVALPVMTEIRDSYPAIQALDYLYLYLPLKMLGIMMVAGIISFYAFHEEKTFRQNFGQWLAPFLVLLIGLPILTAALSPADYSIERMIPGLILDGVAVGIGSVLGRRAQNRMAT